MDRVGKRVDLSAYLPLFRELSAYTRRTSPSQRYALKSIEELRERDPAYAARLEVMTEDKYREADACIAEAETLLQLVAEERLRLRFYQEHIFKTKVIYYDTMDDSDRDKVLEFVGTQFEQRFSPRQNSKDMASRMSWRNPESGISYTLGYSESYTMRVGKTDEHMPCIRFSLAVDLATSVPVEIPTIRGKKSKMGNGVLARFCDYHGVKKLQLTGAENW